MPRTYTIVKKNYLRLLGILAMGGAFLVFSSGSLSSGLAAAISATVILFIARIEHKKVYVENIALLAAAATLTPWPLAVAAGLLLIPYIRLFGTQYLFQPTLIYLALVHIFIPIEIEIPILIAALIALPCIISSDLRATLPYALLTLPLMDPLCILLGIYIISDERTSPRKRKWIFSIIAGVLTYILGPFAAILVASACSGVLER